MSYGGLQQAKSSYLKPPSSGHNSDSETDGSGSQSDSYSGQSRTTRLGSDRFQLWSSPSAAPPTIPEDDPLVISAVEELGETYTSGRINRLEFEQRSALVETFAKHKIEVANNAAAESAGSPFLVVAPGDEDKPEVVLRVCWTRCWRAAIQATLLFARTLCCCGGYCSPSCVTGCLERL